MSKPGYRTRCCAITTAGWPIISRGTIQLLNDDCPVFILGHGYSHMGVCATLLNPEECLGGWGNHIAQLKKVG